MMMSGTSSNFAVCFMCVIYVRLHSALQAPRTVIGGQKGGLKQGKMSGTHRRSNVTHSSSAKKHAGTLWMKRRVSYGGRCDQ